MYYRATFVALFVTIILRYKVVAYSHGSAFVSHTIRNGGRKFDHNVIRTTASMIARGFDDDREHEIAAFREEQKRSALVEALMGSTSAAEMTPMSSSSLLSMDLVGSTSLPTGDNKTVASCLILAPRSRSTTSPTDIGATYCLLVPVSSESPGALKLLSFAFKRRPVTKSVLVLSLNPLLVNRDNGLFDNLPWSTWTIDPEMRNRDAANNLILPKFHLGKRDAYQRFLGKDWPGRSLAIGNLALRLQYSAESNPEKSNPFIDENSDDSQGDDSFSTESMTSLAQRILELQLRDLTMALAEWDYQLAVARANSNLSTDNLVAELQFQRQETFDRLQEGQNKLKQLKSSSKSSSISTIPNQIASQNNLDDSLSSSSSGLSGLLDDVAQWTTNYGKNAAPYRGATGYAPFLDSRRQVEASFLPTYTSPYDVMKDIIEDQLNAECIGVVLENTSFFQLSLGGAIVLQRKTSTRSKTIMGETVTVRDEDEDFGNPGVCGGETVLVECHADEAIGMALAYRLPIRVPTEIWEQAKLLAKPSDASSSLSNSSNVFDAIPLWQPLDANLTLLKEGQPRNSTSSSSTPIRIPKTTSSLWDSMMEGPASGSTQRSGGLFPTDNPIQSLTQYDDLTNQDKARVLLSLSNFQGRLPRPRVVRQAEKGQKQENGPSPLDQLLLPLIDESVRREYLIRDAERRGDRDMLEQLLATKSMRQTAKERAEAAQSEEDKEYWQSEAEFYASLRADVTQDEGTYNRFLDRDEWYERNRQAQAKRVNKKLFGTLLDGIE